MPTIVNHITAASGKPYESRTTSFGIKSPKRLDDVSHQDENGV
jgi:hypothetical protein